MGNHRLEMRPETLDDGEAAGVPDDAAIVMLLVYASREPEAGCGSA